MNKVLAPVWLETQHRWQLNATIDGKRRTFVCREAGRKGQQKCMESYRKALKGLVSPNTKMAVLWDAFLQDTQDRTSIGNYTNLESIGRNWILPKIGHKSIAKLTEQDMQDIINAAYKKGRAKKTLMAIRGAFTAFLRFARKSKATDLRADDLVIPNKAKTKGHLVLNQDDLKKLFEISTVKGKEDFYIHAYRFLVSTGLRPSELYELQKTKQPTDGRLAVTGGYNRFGEHTEGKTGNAKRTFILPDIAASVLSEQAAMLKAKGIISPYLFPQKDGSQLYNRLLYGAWKRYQTANGLTPISLYELRHTFVSLCQHTIPEPLIKPMLGHSSAMPSYGTYGHQMDGDAEIVVGLVNDIFSAK